VLYILSQLLSIKENCFVLSILQGTVTSKVEQSRAERRSHCLTLGLHYIACIHRILSLNPLGPSVFENETQRNATSPDPEPTRVLNRERLVFRVSEPRPQSAFSTVLACLALSCLVFISRLFHHGFFVPVNVAILDQNNQQQRKQPPRPRS
jgi:hypothetical protein